MTRSAGWVGVLFLGVAVGLWSHAFFPALQFDTKVSVAAIGNLFVALAIGFLVHHFATLRHAQMRAEKDFVMKKAEQLAAKLEVARGVFDQCLKSRPQISNNEVQTLLLALRSVFNAAFEIEQASAICELKDAVARTAQIKVSRSFDTKTPQPSRSRESSPALPAKRSRPTGLSPSRSSVLLWP